MLGEQHPNGIAGRTEADNLESAQKRQRAVKLRISGRTYRSIAASLGCSVSTAHGYIDDELAELRRETSANAEHLRDLEIARLDSIEAKCRKELRLADAGDTARLAAVIVKVSESRRKLQGLDAPAKVEVSGNLYTVKEASPECSDWDAPRKDPE